MSTKQKEINMENALAERPIQLPTNPMAILAQAVEKGVAVGELTQLMDLAERYDNNCAKAAFNAAVARFQALCPPVHKCRNAKSSGKFEGYSFASFDDVMRVAKPHLDACELGVAFSFKPVDKGIETVVTISHGSHSRDYTCTVPIPSNLSVNDTQRYGACMRYAQRYALCGALNIVVTDEDSDAEGLEELISEKQADEIETLLMETNSDVGRFLKWAGTTAIVDMTVEKYHEAKKMLEAKPKA